MTGRHPERMRLTVAVATCGRPQALARCLKAIGQQTRAPDQLIVIEQAASAEGREAIRASGLSVDYHEQPKLGLSASRNLALAHAEGTVLGVTDDDCFPDPDWTAAIWDVFDVESPPTALTGPILAPAGETPAAMHAISLRTSRDTLDFCSRTIPWFVGSGGNFAALVTQLRAIGGWDERLGAGSRGMAAEDCDLIDRLLQAGERIRYEGSAVVRHDWQTHDRRMATRWSYGFGIGALCGLRLADHDFFALRMLRSYSVGNLRRLMHELARLNWSKAGERINALAGLAPGCLYGLRMSGAPLETLGKGKSRDVSD